MSNVQQFSFFGWTIPWKLFCFLFVCHIAAKCCKYEYFWRQLESADAVKVTEDGVCDLTRLQRVALLWKSVLTERRGMFLISVMASLHIWIDWQIANYYFCCHGVCVNIYQNCNFQCWQTENRIQLLCFIYFSFLWAVVWFCTICLYVMTSKSFYY